MSDQKSTENHSENSTSQRPPPTPSAGAGTGSGQSHYSTRSEHLSRPFKFFNPTRAEFTHHAAVSQTELTQEKPPSQWTSRASRKNRYSPAAFRVRHHHEQGEGKLHSEMVMVEQRLLRPGARLKVHLTWDISFWVAVIFILGSTAWIVNGFYLFLPLVNIGGDHTTAAAWWAFAGGTWFELGSYLMLVEALNTGHDQLFGPALWGLVSRHPEPDERLLSEKEEGNGGSKGTGNPKFRWIGLGSFHDLGFLACFVQMFAASIFWISTITGIPHVIPNLATSPPVAIADVFFWTPQVIGGTGFIISSTLLMLEVQTKWWKPNLKSLGWHIAVWNLVGAFGFTLCGALGYAAISSTKANYQSVLSTFWGSFAFEIGSVIQFWETLWREDPKQGDNSEASS